MVHQPHNLSQVCLATQVNYAIELRVIVPSLSDLDELDSPPEMIDYFLIALGLPPFDGHVELATGYNEPERRVLSGQFLNLGIPGFFEIRYVNVSSEGRGFDAQFEVIVQKINEPVKAMIRHLIRAADQRVITVNCLDRGIVLTQRSNEGVVLPQLRAIRAHIGQKLARIALMQIA